MGGMHLSDESYLAALERQRDRIKAGLPFDAVDSDVVGDKFTHASWGLCSRDKDAWPSPDDNLFAGRVSPKYRHQHQVCPMQRKGGPQGCFFSCRIFKHREITANKRERAVALYDALIATRKESQQ